MSRTTCRFTVVRNVRTAVVSMTAVVLAGCGETGDLTAPTYRPTTPVAPPAMRTAVIASVDLTDGTMTFEPASSSPTYNSASGVSAAIYGNQGVTVRMYNGAVTVSASATPGKKQFTTMVGVRNLLAHAIGDEQAGASADTIGIDVFMVGEPSVKSTSSACPVACTVVMRDHHGVRAFTAPGQKYWHWHEVLGAAGSGTDTTRTRMRFTFEADTQVTNFRFTVMVNAPWPAPYESRYKVDYQGDALPTATTASPWKLTLTGDAVVSQANGGLTIDAKTGSAFYHRRDSIGQSQSAYVEARVMWNGITQSLTEAEPRFAIVDGTKYVALGIFPNGVGFVNSSGALVGTKYALVPTTYQTYRVQKYAADSAVFYVNGTRGGVLTYSALPASPHGTATRVEFGATNSKKLTSSTWDYLVYEVGVATP